MLKNCFKFGLPLMFVLVICVGYWGVAGNHQQTLGIEKIEVEVELHFKSFKKIPSDETLPSIDITAPNGDVIDISKSQGKYTVLNLWATWCSPCLKELPALKNLQNALSGEGKWQVIAVSLDSPETAEKVMTLTQSLGVFEMAGYYDAHAEVQKALNPMGLPTTLIIAPSGRILYEIQGEAVWDDPAIIKFLNLIPELY